MSEFSFWMLLLPVVFMIHDFEEILFFKPWIRNNREILIKRFSQLSTFVSEYEGLSVSAFALGVAEEFILISLISFVSVYSGNYYLWLAIFIGFSVHLFIHVVQWAVMRIYIPAIVTTFLVFPYSIGMLVFIFKSHLFTLTEVLLWGTGGVIGVGVNLWLVHKLMKKFDRQWTGKNR